ncbi:hypothetical protein HanRHA438_Chr03g0133921 [Helianthus annuus]|nr:hypothetical protein HanRHA438_Chr03g0133921 [Helianthus annuus]
MVRNFPIGANPRSHSLPSRAFIFAFIAATITIVSFLCGKKKRKRSLSSTNHATTRPNDTTNQPLVSTTNDHTNDATNVKIEDHDNDPSPPESTIQIENKVLPPPPRLASIRATSCHIGESSNRSQSVKLTSSLSMRLTGGLKGLKKGTKKDENVHENDKLTREDSLLNKTIILGGKCRIPDEDEDDIILDENGQRITTFHRRQSGSSLSRQSSDANQDLIRNEQQKH